MKTAVSNVEEHLNILQGQLFAACRLGAWCFDDNQKLYMTTAPHSEELYRLLLADGCLDTAENLQGQELKPYVLSGRLGLEWVAEWVHLQNDGWLLILLGPALMKNMSAERSMKLLERQGLPLHSRQQYLNLLRDIPVLSWEMMEQYVKILHYIIYEENLNQTAIRILEVDEAQEPAEEENKTEQNKESADYERMLQHEHYMLDNLGKDWKPDDEGGNYKGELQDFHLKDFDRQLKDNLIIFTALCARSAIQKGVPIRTARNMEADWIARIEKIQSPAEGADILQKLYGAFSSQVKHHMENMGLSGAVRACMDFVNRNYTQELKLSDIAKHCGYSEYYLTRKFARETGVKLTDYITQVRLEAAKVMLLTSRKDIQLISEQLKFGSRSYFDRVFRSHMGVSPKQFRDSMGQSGSRPADDGRMQNHNGI